MTRFALIGNRDDDVAVALSLAGRCDFRPRLPTIANVNNHDLPLRVSAVCFFAMVVGCATTIPRKADVPMPDPKLGTVDFSALFDDRAVSLSVYPSGAESFYPELMKRVLLSPNLVFESSRSSEKAPETTGPEGATSPELDLHDALGKPIRVSLSSLLIEYLANKGSVLIAPAVTRTLESPVLDSPADGTWVERLLGARPRPEDVNQTPTVSLAVRELGMATLHIPVVAKRGKDDTISFFPRQSVNEVSACGDVTLEVPTVLFAAEVVGQRDGHLVARIHERRFPEVDVVQHASIELIDYRPLKRDAYAKSQWGRPLEESKYTYVRKWKARDVYCRRSLNTYERILREAEQAISDQLPLIAAKILAESLDELYPSGGLVERSNG